MPKFFHRNVINGEQSNAFVMVALCCLLSIVIGLFSAYYGFTGKILILLGVVPILIVMPPLSFNYILLEAWLTKEFPLIGVSFVHPLITPALLATILLMLYIFNRIRFHEDEYRIPYNALHVVVVLFFMEIVISGYLTWGEFDLTWINNLVFYFLVIIFVKTTRRIDMLVLTGIFGSVIMGLSGIVQLILNRGIPVDGISGGLSNHVQYSWICWMGLPLTVVAWGKARSFLQKSVFLGAFLLLSVAILISLTRSVTMIFLISLPFFFPGLKNKIWYFVALIIFTIMILQIPSIQSRLTSLEGLFSGDKGTVNAALSGRLTLYQSALQMFLQNPIYGAGYKSFKYNWAYYAWDSDVWSGSSIWSMNMSAHSTFLQIAAELGLIGLSLYIGIFALAFWNLRKAQKETRLFNSGHTNLPRLLQIVLFGFFIMSIFDNGGWQERYFYLFVALSVTLRRSDFRARKDSVDIV